MVNLFFLKKHGKLAHEQNFGPKIFPTYMSYRDLVTQNSMTKSQGMQGHGEYGLVLFSQMQETKVNSNHITFIGLMDMGQEYFHCMTQYYFIVPAIEHCEYMVYLYCVGYR